jgi:hypothetical protein
MSYLMLFLNHSESGWWEHCEGGFQSNPHETRWGTRGGLFCCRISMLACTRFLNRTSHMHWWRDFSEWLFHGLKISCSEAWIHLLVGLNKAVYCPLMMLWTVLSNLIFWWCCELSCQIRGLSQTLSLEANLILFIWVFSMVIKLFFN